MQIPIICSLKIAWHKGISRPDHAPADTSSRFGVALCKQIDDACIMPPKKNDVSIDAGTSSLHLNQQGSNALPTFRVGEIYDRRRDIHGPFGGSAQSGISPSAKSPAIFLFTGDSGKGFGYRDHREDDGTYLYTGEGQEGPMRFTKGNLAIREHSNAGRALHLFKSQGKGKGQRYLGEFVCQGYEMKTLPDRNKHDREAIIFRLVPVELLAQQELASVSVGVAVIPLEEARARAVASARMDGAIDVKQQSRNVYERNESVRAYVLMRANGICELCECPAPFRRMDTSPYLEPHHTTRMSDGGPDHPRHVAALCPACHREVHYGEQGQEKNFALRAKLADKERD
ncbi:HNH endonuclease [Bordetella sp. LUAb4]|uniref:HNH endonuclease n=1 Tax=Bordetella sp. LUAb4 TaxID=2843195 RepID=UPI001E2CFC6A|nr:HNH endonuclease [Bordetella sp. LUAb4]